MMRPPGALLIRGVAALQGGRWRPAGVHRNLNQVSGQQPGSAVRSPCARRVQADAQDLDHAAVGTVLRLRRWPRTRLPAEADRPDVAPLRLLASRPRSHQPGCVS